MSAFSDHAEGKVLDLFFRGTPWTAKPTTLYFGLLTTAPSDTGGGTEVSAGGYARKAVTCDTTNWTKIAIQGNPLVNAVPIAFAKATASWGTVTYIGIYDAASGGNLLMWKALTAPKAVAVNETLTFAAGDLSFNFTGAIGYYLSSVFLNWFFAGVTFPTIATHYFALGTGADAASISGEASQTTDHATNFYKRLSVANNGTSYGAADATGDPQKANAIAFDFATATATWGGPLTHFAVVRDPRLKTAITSSTTGTSHNITTPSAHGLAVNDLVVFTGSAPTGLTADGVTVYYVVNVGSTTTFRVSTALGGTGVNVTVTGTGFVTRISVMPVFTSGAGVNITTGVLTVASHTFIDGDVIQLHKAAGATFPTGLAGATDYYIRDVTSTTFKLAATAGGTAIIPSDVGSGSFYAQRTNEHVIWFGDIGVSLTTAAGDVPGWSVGRFTPTLD